MSVSGEEKIQMEVEKKWWSSMWVYDIGLYLDMDKWKKC